MTQHPGLQERKAVWQSLGLQRGWTLHQAMQQALADRPDAIAAFHAPGTDIDVCTLADLHVQAKRLAAGLVRAGLGRDDVIAVQLPNAREIAVFAIAAARLGCVLLPIVHIFGPKELGYILKDSGARALVVSTQWKKGLAAERLSELETLPDRIIVVGPVIEGVETLSYNELLQDQGGVPMPENVDPETVALLLYTSGTTAAPKGVRHTHTSLLAEFFAQAVNHGDTRSAWLCPWPSGHIAGTMGLLSHSLLGRDSVIMQQWDAVAAAHLISDYKVEQTSGTPLHLTGILEAAREHRLDLSSLKRFITGATTVPETIVARAEAAGVKACRAYGSTELPTSTQCSEFDPLEKRLTTDGRPRPGCEVRIVDESLNDVPTGQEGEILVRGAELAQGYTNAERTAEAFLDEGWFRTGDIGRLDEDGFMTVTDRKKDIIIRGGENISSLEVEDLILQIPSVREVAAVAAPDERLGEVVCAFVVLQPDASIDIPAISAHFQARGVARQKTPERLELVDALPRNPTGKVLKTELRDRLRQA